MPIYYCAVWLRPFLPLFISLYRQFWIRVSHMVEMKESIYWEWNCEISGSVDKHCVEVTNCFCVPHKEYEERVEADLKFAEDMYDLNKKVAPQESVIGWFATGNEITSHSALIHDYYARGTKDPIHLTVDATLNSGKITMKAYVL